MTGAGAEREGDALTRRLLDGVTVGLALLDSAGRVLMANRAAERLLGYAEGALVGLALADLYTPIVASRAGRRR